jgi:hypothetical protein
MSDNICNICFQYSEPLIKFRCLHKFHNECIEQAQRSNCSVCFTRFFDTIYCDYCEYQSGSGVSMTYGHEICGTCREYVPHRCPVCPKY